MKKNKTKAGLYLGGKAIGEATLKSVDVRKLSRRELQKIVDGESTHPKPPGIPMILFCPKCHKRHLDEGEWAHRSHTTHACQHCGMVWRPAVVPTVGVKFLPGFKNDSMNVPISYINLGDF